MANTTIRPLVAPISRADTQGSANTAIPQRYEGPEELLAPPRRYSTLNGKFTEQREQLKNRIHAKEHVDDPLPVLTKADQSDSYSKSPWARKIILCLGKSTFETLKQQWTDMIRWWWCKRIIQPLYLEDVDVLMRRD
jgi:hypothetical protein